MIIPPPTLSHTPLRLNPPYQQLNPPLPFSSLLRRQGEPATNKCRSPATMSWLSGILSCLKREGRELLCCIPIRCCSQLFTAFGILRQRSSFSQSLQSRPYSHFCHNNDYPPFRASKLIHYPSLWFPFYIQSLSSVVQWPKVLIFKDY